MNPRCRNYPLVVWVILASTSPGCQWLCHDKFRPPHITARPASPGNQCSPAGIPFYLPKPVLVISKNFYHIEDPKVGLTGTAPIPNGFDNQAEYADLALNGEFTRSGKSEMNSSSSGAGAASAKAADDDTGEGDGEQSTSLAHTPTLHSKRIPSAPERDAIPGDGLGPHTFFTYEILFVPDLTEKYVLEVNGGPGEIRAAMNLVNGWQFTGLGPYYMKDSSTAQNCLAKGVALNLGLGGAADVINSVANLKSLAGEGKAVDPSALAAMAAELEAAKKTTVFDVADFKDMWTKKTITYADGSEEVVMVPPTLERYAEIYVYEAVNEAGQMVWKPVANHSFDRQYLGVMRSELLSAQGAADGPTRIEEFRTEPAIPGQDSAAPPEGGAPENIPTPAIPLGAGNGAEQSNTSLVAIAAQQALLTSAMQAAGYQPATSDQFPQAGFSGFSAQSLEDDGARLNLATPVFTPAPVEGAKSPGPILGAQADAQAVRQALAPACTPRKTSWHDRLFPWKKAEHRSSEVNGLVSQ